MFKIPGLDRNTGGKGSIGTAQRYCYRATKTSLSASSTN